MYDTKIEKLIEYALSDGGITEKERALLFRKAEEAGIDSDEFEMVLEARLYEKQQSDTLKNQQKEIEIQRNAPVMPVPKSNKYGDIRKCPACGALVESYSIECSDCGHEYTNIDANTSFTKLFNMLNGAEDTRQNSIPDDMREILSSNLSSNVTDNKKREIIKNFPIPTTKGDILEFLAMAIPNAAEKGSFFTKMTNDSYARHNEFTGVWKAKCEQIIIKARLSMKSDKSTLEEILIYAKKLKID